jgi:hypothetical protein
VIDAGAGDKLFVDYSGKKIAIVDPATGEVRDAEIFVAVLGGLELHLRRSDLDADAAGLDRGPCADVPLLWRRAASRRARQSQERRAQGVLLRS